MNESYPYGKGHVKIINPNIGDHTRPYDQDMAGEWVDADLEDSVTNNVTYIKAGSTASNDEQYKYHMAAKGIPITGAVIVAMASRRQKH